MLQVSQIYLYPVKSCGGCSVDGAELETRGFSGDRRYMVVNGNGLFLSQRTHPHMALVRLQPAEGGFLATKDGQPDLTLPPAMATGGTRRVLVWRDEVEAVVAPRATNEWFSAALRTRCELVFMNEPQGRGVKAGYGRAEDDLSFADGAPVLLTSEESLDALNGKLEAPVEMTRFRPNLVARVGEAFAEDRWRHVRVGHAAFDVEWPCSRCPVPTVDPETGIRDGNREPLRTLSEFRSTSNGAMFGQNLIPRKLGRVRVGDRIEVVESVGS